MHSTALETVTSELSIFPSSTQETVISGHSNSMTLPGASNAMAQTGHRISACPRRGPESTATIAATVVTEADRIAVLLICIASRGFN